MGYAFELKFMCPNSQSTLLILGDFIFLMWGWFKTIRSQSSKFQMMKNISLFIFFFTSNWLLFWMTMETTSGFTDLPNSKCIKLREKKSMQAHLVHEIWFFCVSNKKGFQIRMVNYISGTHFNRVPPSAKINCHAKLNWSEKREKPNGIDYYSAENFWNLLNFFLMSNFTVDTLVCDNRKIPACNKCHWLSSNAWITHIFGENLKALLPCVVEWFFYYHGNWSWAEMI